MDTQEQPSFTDKFSGTAITLIPLTVKSAVAAVYGVYQGTDPKEVHDAILDAKLRGNLNGYGVPNVGTLAPLLIVTHAGEFNDDGDVAVTRVQFVAPSGECYGDYTREDLLILEDPIALQGFTEHMHEQSRAAFGVDDADYQINHFAKTAIADLMNLIKRLGQAAIMCVIEVNDDGTLVFDDNGNPKELPQDEAFALFKKKNGLPMDLLMGEPFKVPEELQAEQAAEARRYEEQAMASDEPTHPDASGEHK